jgi:hypothetical protein
MIVTEDQAKEMWWPIVRIPITADVGGAWATSYNDTHPRDEGHARCIGSRCMMWRWAGYLPVPSATVPGQDEAHGYCGLAGLPQELAE